MRRPERAGNNTAIDAGIFTDLERDGPMIIDSPEGVDGVIDDFWERPVVAVPISADADPPARPG